jgi:hypothetical protein
MCSYGPSPIFGRCLDPTQTSLEHRADKLIIHEIMMTFDSEVSIFSQIISPLPGSGVVAMLVSACGDPGNARNGSGAAKPLRASPGGNRYPPLKPLCLTWTVN